MVSVIIAAAGSGKRMGKSMNKVYLDLLGFPVLYHTVRAFEINPAVDEIIVAVKEEEKEYFKEKFKKYGFIKLKEPVTGGTERMHSVSKALYNIDPSSEIVLIHDGARPFITLELTDKVIEATRKYGACTPGVVPKDTVKVIDEEGFIVDSPERSTLRAVQTPQGFNTKELKRCYGLAKESGRIFTDDSAVYSLGGGRTFITEGDYTNIKITTEEDLLTAVTLMENCKSKENSTI